MTTLPVIVEELSYVSPTKVKIHGEERDLPPGYIVEMAENGLRLKYSEIRDLGIYSKGEKLTNAVLDDMNVRLHVLTKR